MTPSAEPRLLTVELGDRSYPIRIGSGLLSDPTLIADRIHGRRILVVTDANVAPLYLETSVQGLLCEAVDIEQLVLAPGEDQKTPDVWLTVVDKLVAMGATRDVVVVTLGGGVIGDLGGFTAATYMRGIDFIQIPTTLLAQVDASVGGKTGVNHPRGKNLIGAFHQPRAVLIDVDALKTLPDREFAAGLAETVKYGAIRDTDFFAWLEGRTEPILQRRPDLMIQAVERACRTKANIVAADETEQGVRTHLNFGHSFGHAIETLTEYRRFLHGEAVAIGMVLAARLSERLELCPGGIADRLSRLLDAFGLPTRLPGGLATEDLWAAMALDKKNRAGEVRLVLLEALGRSIVKSGIPETDVAPVLAGRELAG